MPDAIDARHLAATPAPTLPPAITPEPVEAPFDAVVRLPGSKSLTNRALVLAALAGTPVTLENVLLADDTVHMLDNLATLGLKIERQDTKGIVHVDAPASVDFATQPLNLYCGNSGTTLRFLTAMLSAVGDAEFVLDGNERMRQRPVGPLVSLLNDLGAAVGFAENEGTPPVKVLGRGISGGQASFGTEQSSQFLSAVLMSATHARGEVAIELTGPQTSWPYVQMTMRLMDEFGVTPELERSDTGTPKRVIVPRGRYHREKLHLEPDASTASYFLGLAAIHPGSRVRVEGLGRRSLQGDVRFAELLKAMGATVELEDDALIVVGPAQLTGIEADMADMPDVAQTLAVVALFAVGETRLTGLHTLRVKETDRIAALQNELTKLGAEVSVEGDDAITIIPPARVRRAEIATYDDHRMAMSFALAATRRRDVTILNPACVSKTFPGFFKALHQVATGRA